jgi:deoxyinosine 3'endonuclease (endonuclease V)
MKSIAWPKSISEAKVAQAALRHKVRIIPLSKNPRLIAGVDASFTDGKVIGVACLLAGQMKGGDDHPILLKLVKYLDGLISLLNADLDAL